MLNVHWKVTVHIPQLNALEGQLMAGLQEIRNAIAALGQGQAAQTAALGELLTAIAVEVEHVADVLGAEEDVVPFAIQIRDAATLAESQAEDIRAHTRQMQGMIPDALPAEPPTDEEKL